MQDAANKWTHKSSLWQYLLFVGLVGGGGSPPSGPWLCMLSPAGWLPRVRDQLRPLTLDYEYGKPLPFLLFAVGFEILFCIDWFAGKTFYCLVISRNTNILNVAMFHFLVQQKPSMFCVTGHIHCIYMQLAWTSDHERSRSCSAGVW